MVRKRIHFENAGDRHISYSLRTKQVSVARVRAAAVCAALNRVVAMINQDATLQIGGRSASELSNIARRMLDAQMGFALQDQIEAPGPDADEASLAFGDYYSLGAQQAGPVELTDEAREALVAQGNSDQYMRKLELLIRHNRANHPMSDAHLKLQLERIGVEFLPLHADIDRRLVLNAMAEAQRRAPLFQAHQLADHDAIQRLLNGRQSHLAPTPDTITHEMPTQLKQDPASSSSSNKPRLSEIAEQTVNRIVQQGRWKAGRGGTAEDALRLVRQFAWMIGDKPVDQYTQTDIADFASDLFEMPKTVRVQKVWHQPYTVAKAKFDTLGDHNRRNPRTMNKDLSYLATFAKRMVSDGHWAKDTINPLLLGHKVTAKQKAKAKSPWTVSHVEKMVSCPIYTGNAGPKRRTIPGDMVYHDAGYWLLLLAVYSGAGQNELAGLLLDEIITDGTMIPHLVIQPNRLRSLKRDARERVVPIHPRLLALGFLDYVDELRKLGSTELFEELWVNKAKRGGDQYRAIVWDKIMNWMKQQDISIPTGMAGKKADFQSLRSSVLSLLDRADINQNIVKDIAGHAREGVTACTYQDLILAGGLEDALNERLIVLKRLPDFARQISYSTPCILPVEHRSR